MEQEFLIKDFTNNTDRQHPVCEYRTVHVDELLKLLDKAKDNSKLKFSVYKLGDCCIDWS